MAEKKKGYVPIYRSIQDNWIWKKDEPFDYRSAWIDILLSVNHEEKRIFIDGRVQDIQPGQMWTSIKKLGEKWHWSRPRVYRYIKSLKSDGMIYTDGTPSGTLITVKNWDFFNTQRNTNVTTNVTPSVTPPVTSTVTSTVTQTIMNNNVNNEKELKEKGIEYLPIEPPTGGGEWQ